MPIGSRRRLAVLIDAENTPHWIADDVMRGAAVFGEPLLRRAYGDFHALGGWLPVLATHAIEPRQVLASATGKNATDIAMVVDAMDLLHSGRFDGFCIASCDSDFTRLAMRMRENGVGVHGFGHRSPPDALRAACADYTVIPPRTKLPEKPVSPPPLSLAELIHAAMGDKLHAPDGMLLGELGSALRSQGYVAGAHGAGTLRQIIARCGAFEVTGAGHTMRVRLRHGPSRPSVVAAE